LLLGGSSVSGLERRKKTGINTPLVLEHFQEICEALKLRLFSGSVDVISILRSRLRPNALGELGELE
jgi:hypothetical protein